MPAKLVKLTIVSDVACPWCYIGQKEVIGAIDDVTTSFPNISFEVEYRPYRLNPSVHDDEPQDKLAWLIKKFGVEKTNMIQDRIAARAKQCGLDIKVTAGKLCSTFRAHKLLFKAWKVGGQKTQQAMLSGIFKAYFTDVADISDKGVLADIAEKAGVLGRKEALKYLESEEDCQTVVEMMDQARANGVSGVPLMIIDGKWAISGGQSKDVYLQIFKKLAICNGGGSPPHTIETDSDATCLGPPPTCEPTPAY